MIISYESGRLGNQLFQYFGLKKLSGNEKIFFVGMNSLVSTFDNININKNFTIIEKIIQIFGKKRLKYISKKFRIISYAEENIIENECRYFVKRGLISSVVYFDTAYFQSETMIEEEIVSSIRIKSNLLKRADDIFKKLPADRAETFFVHIRRGDYVKWPVGSPAILPLAWYHEQMDQIRVNFRKPFFILVSDDKPYAEKMFGNLADVYVSHESEGVEFALMTKCPGGGILSASSFSWWAAYFVRQANRDAAFIAPLYWAGHRRGT